MIYKYIDTNQDSLYHSLHNLSPIPLYILIINNSVSHLRRFQDYYTNLFSQKEIKNKFLNENYTKN